MSTPPDHDWAIRCAFVEASRVPASCRAAHLATLPDAIAEEVRSLLCLVSEDEAAEAPVDHWFGRRLGRWTLGVELGRGGHGRVFRGFDAEGRSPAASPVAIKVLEDSGGDLQTRLDREVATIAVLDHPGIVRVVDHGIVVDGSDSVAFLAMDLVEGGEPMLDWAARVRPDLEARLDLIDRLLDVLAHAHARGVVHRDLKSSNVLIDDTGSPRIIDFGIARILDDTGHGVGLHATGTQDRHTIVGSLAHLAPEQVDRRIGPASTATDVHAVGLLAYRLLCGEPPYDATGSVVQAIQAVLHVPPADPAIFAPQLPRAICDWLLGCLAKDPSARPADAGDARALLEHARTSGGLTAPSPNHKTGHATGGGHGQRVAVAVVAITAAIVAGAMLLPRSGGENPASSMSFDPITQGTDDSRGAGDSEMSMRPILGAVVGGAVASGAACAQDAVQWRVEDGGNGHWYSGVVSPNISWTTARASCLATGGDLVSLNSEAESDFVFQTLAGDSNLWNNRFGPWIGLRQDPNGREPSGGWSWVDGTSVDYANWNPDGFHGQSHPVDGGTCLNSDFGAYYAWPTTPMNSWGSFQNDHVSSCHWETSRSFIIEWSADCNNDGIVDYGQILDGTFSDDDENGVPDCCDGGSPCDPCTGDITGNGQVDAADLGILLAVWNTNGKSNPEADINGDGTVDAADLGLLIANWGPCPE
jgi:hypothetical protein